MTSLRQAIAERPRRERIWSVAGRWLDAQAISELVESVACRIDLPRIALAFTRDEDLALAILAAEGVCESVLLVPASWDRETISRYLPQAETDLLVTSRDDLEGPRTLRLDPRNVEGGASARTPGVDTRWIVPTSGTTGDPKLVEYTLDALARTVKADREIGGRYTWGLVYELARFAGLQVLLQAVLGGSRLVFTPRDEPLTLWIDSLLAAECNALSATPTLWRRLLMTPASDRLPLELITLGGEIADPSILGALASTYPEARIVHIYASTEAGVGFSVADGRAGFPASFLDRPSQGTELRVDDQGTLWLRPAVVGQRFLGSERRLADDSGWIDSGDRVHREGDRYLFLGRANGTINVGGNKVYPEEVERCIRATPGVQLVAVGGRANPFTGQLVEAKVRPDPTADLDRLKRDILERCRAELEPHKVPAVIQWAADLETTAAGKVARR